MSNELTHNPGQFDEVIHIIDNARSRAMKAVNAELIQMYWSVGAYLSELCSASSFGDKIIDEVAAYIAQENPNIKGFNRRGLYRMKQFYETYKDDPERYVDYLRHLHLDRTVGLEEFGAVAPIFPAPGMKIWYPDVSIVNMGYGYAIELTPLHTLTLYNAVANDGCMVAPRLVREIRRGGEVVERPERRVLVDKICSSSALRKVRECLEEVGTTGTAKQFFRDTTLFKIAGKTGTAQFAQDGIKYSDGYYLGTMVLYFPADEPKYTVLTAMFTRRGRGTTYYGAGLSGPVEQQIVNYIYNRQREWYGRVEETDDAHYARTVKGGDIAQIREAAGELMPRVVSERRSGWGRTRVDSLGRVTVTPLADDPHTMPDVRGMGLKEAVFLLESRGLRVAFTGKGAVREQTLPPGAKIQRGQTVTLKLR